MNRTFAALAAVAASMTMCAQQEDPIVMRIDNKEITRSELEYSYNKNNTELTVDRKLLDEYVQLFIDMKLKVAEAESMGLDTMASFRNELKGYRNQQAQEYLVDTAFIEREAQATYERTRQNIGPEGLVRTQHILLRIPQDAEPQVQQQALARMDSIRQALLNGADFAALAASLSEDPGSARQGGMLPWLFAKQVYPEYARVAYSLQPGELSQPFVSPAGVHVVKLVEKKQFEPYEHHRKNIITFLERRGIRQKAMEVTADSLYAQYGGRVKREEVLAYEDSLLEEKHPEFRHLMQEYYDGLLLFEASNRCVWEKAARDEEGLERFFKKNRKKYAWDTPRYKGAVVHCQTQDVADRVQREMKKMPQEEWRAYIQKEINQDSLRLAYMERGLFKVGDNANTDHYVFKQGEPKPKEKYPCTVVVGELQKKYPQAYKDVRGPVTADYQTELERAWVQQLRKKFDVEIYEDVLRTVNNH